MVKYLIVMFVVVSMSVSVYAETYIPDNVDINMSPINSQKNIYRENASPADIIIRDNNLMKDIDGIDRDMELSDIKNMITYGNHRWEARHTFTSKMSKKERNRLSGAVVDKQSINSAAAAAMGTTSVVTAPAGGFDWRNLNGNSYVTDVKYQGNCGSCWAFATTATFESWRLITGKYDASSGTKTASAPSGSNDLSEQILLSCSGAGNCDGGSALNASTYIRALGMQLETCYPYTSTVGACTNACSSWPGNAYKLGVGAPGQILTVPQTVKDMKNYLYSFGPMIVAYALFDDFYYYGSGVYSHTNGRGYQTGYHAVQLVGYKDDASYPGGGYFIVKNSWGNWWGEAGYFRIAYSEVTSEVQFGIQNISLYASTLPARNQRKVTAVKSGVGNGTVVANRINCGTACSELDLQGMNLKVSATANSGSTLLGWEVYTQSGVLTFPIDPQFPYIYNPLTIAVDGDMTIKANFK